MLEASPTPVHSTPGSAPSCLSVSPLGEDLPKTGLPSVRPEPGPQGPSTVGKAEGQSGLRVQPSHHETLVCRIPTQWPCDPAKPLLSRRSSHLTAPGALFQVTHQDGHITDPSLCPQQRSAVGSYPERRQVWDRAQNPVQQDKGPRLSTEGGQWLYRACVPSPTRPHCAHQVGALSLSGHCVSPCFSSPAPSSQQGRGVQGQRAVPGDALQRTRSHHQRDQW